MKKLCLVLGLAFSVALSAAVSGLPEKGAKCPVCRMNVTADSKTAYSAVRTEKGKAETVHLCSYSCAHAFHRRDPKGALQAHDFETGEAVPAESAWYVVKSTAIASQVDFSMPPVVGAFKDEARAQAFQKKLGDGRVVQGLSSVEKQYAE